MPDNSVSYAPPQGSRGARGGAEAGTLARLFWSRVVGLGAGVAQRVKRDGQWRDVSWTALGDEVREVALGLLELGGQRGQAIGLLSQTRGEWVRADFAVFSVGGITVPLYPTYPTESIAYIAADSGLAILFVEDLRQLEKAIMAAPGLPDLRAIVLIDGEAPARSAGLPSAIRVLDWSGLRGLGRSHAQIHGSELDRRLATGQPDDVATIVYTSGTTGEPKGVVQTHGNHLAALAATEAVVTGEIREGDVHLLFLPLAHAFGRLESFTGVHRGLTTAFAESLDKLPENLREVSPHFICSVPRVFEKVYARVLAGVAAGSPARRRIFYWALGVGRRVSRAQQAGQKPGVGLALQRALADRLVYRKIHAALGGRLRCAFSGGAPLSPEIAEFFHSLGVLILEGYGLTETCPILTGNHGQRFKFGTVGVPYPGVEVRIAEDGEILARGPNIARGYHRKPAETAEVFGADGWFRTGDIGELDADGFLRITDRKKDLIKTAGGSYIAPQQIENLLKGDPLVSQALVHGDRRPYATALLTLNPDELSRFAKEAGLGEAVSGRSATDPAVRVRLQRTVDEVNSRLPPYAQVKRFAVLAVDFTQEAGELTPTLKLRRRAIAEQYRGTLDALYEPEPRR